ncbi:hypothetical protein BYT27DRAFT_7258318 [Phlegmacium glaucopus]|nr:hypothetical protein BYT27DRAFT_7258318 [Phlegmacium glaucopus]
MADIQSKLFTWVQEHKSEIYNPFLKLDRFNAAVDTPVEILHTILLVKNRHIVRGHSILPTPPNLDLLLDQNPSRAD